MTGEAFERLMCEVFHEMGFWALRIPRNHYGAQPFDVLAINGDKIFAIDCKVCAQPRFPLTRVEDNQQTSMQAMKERTNAYVGFACYHDRTIHLISFDDILLAQQENQASIKLTDQNKWMEV